MPVRVMHRSQTSGCYFPFSPQSPVGIWCTNVNLASLLTQQYAHKILLSLCPYAFCHFWSGHNIVFASQLPQFTSQLVQWRHSQRFILYNDGYLAQTKFVPAVSICQQTTIRSHMYLLHGVDLVLHVQYKKPVHCPASLMAHRGLVVHVVNVFYLRLEIQTKWFEFSHIALL